MNHTLSGGRWVSAHLYYQGDLDTVVTDIVKPVMHAVARETVAKRYFFLRYWESGPHLRLRVLADSDGAADVIRAAIRDRADTFFDLHPSTTWMQDTEYREIRRHAMQLEPWTMPSAELSPNNSVQFVPYRPEHHQYGYGPSMEAFERHFMESSEIALSAVEGAMSVAERELLALCLLILSWSVGCPGSAALADWAQTGTAWFESALSFDPEKTLADRAAQRGQFRALAQHLLDEPASAKPTMRNRWRQSMTALRARLIEAAAVPADDAGTFAMLDRCGHLVCNRLGLSMAQEAVVRTLACRAILDAQGRR